jgi:DNA invertase Pin-like site-specific DNA recombinase
MKRATKRAFSYLRFSDKKQAKGDSLRRQLEWGPALCRSKGWALDESFRLEDLGVSAFRGRNSATGALSEFLVAIRAGKVVPGDILLLESLDRLSREDIDPAWELFRSILKSGVEVCTREPERHYVPADLNNLGTRIEVQAYMLRAYNESATKSMRGKSYWEKARARWFEKKELFHKVTPAWLRLSEDRKRFQVVPAAAKAVKLIYRWAGEGLGLNPITARLNHEGVEPIGNNIRRKPENFKNSWRRSYVAKLLRDRSVLGEFQPHVMKEVPVDPKDPNGPKRWKRVPHGDPIPGYFPQIIPETQWYAVRQAVKERGKERGPKGVGIANLFTGLIFDARDGHTMHLEYSGSSRKGNCRVLVSYGCRNGEPGSVNMPFPYDAVEQYFLAATRELKASDILGDKANGREEEITALSGKLEEIDHKIAKVQRRVMDEGDIDALVTTLEMLDKEKKDTAGRLDRLKAEMAHQEPAAALGEVQSLARVYNAADCEGRKELRVKMKARIKQLVAAIWVLPWDVTPTIRAANIHVVFHSGKLRGLQIAWLRRGKHRGLVMGVAVERPAVEPAIPDLGDYRHSPGLRRLFDHYRKYIAPHIGEAVANEVRCLESAAAVERLKREKGSGAVDGPVCPA